MILSCSSARQFWTKLSKLCLKLRSNLELTKGEAIVTTYFEFIGFSEGPHGICCRVSQLAKSSTVVV